ncbi:hypothetical protein BC831DRAFT_460211 [Entophlyctis helioformis]|nr:hypothetical protein BC831DRAFT_460211 [Entophlyctis helioformis]
MPRSDEGRKRSKRDRDSHKESKESKSRDKGQLATEHELITDADYFAKSAEFQVWLNTEQKLRFGELESSEARSLFHKFVKRWNRGKLADRYYSGIQPTELTSSERTSYKWKLKNVDQMELELTRDSIEAMTGSKTSLVPSISAGRHDQAIGATSFRSPMPRESREGQEGQHGADERRHGPRSLEDRSFKKRVYADIDELVPKETGRDAVIEKRRAQTAYHRAERDVDVEISERDLFDGDSFQAARSAQRYGQAQRDARRKQQRQETAAALATKVDQYRAKEEATIAMFREMAANKK